MSNLIIAMSGASHSGKTTFMEHIKTKFPEKVILLNEEIRDLKIGNIDEIRKNSTEYLKLQFNIIGAKIKAEKKINNKYNNKIILIDRSLIDSYFYYTFYVDKSKLEKKDLISYHRFLNELYISMKYHIKNIYNMVYFLKPITTLTRKDEYTQKDLKYTQENEYRLMRMLTYGIQENIIVNNVYHFNVIEDYKVMESKIVNWINNKNNIFEKI